MNDAVDLVWNYATGKSAKVTGAIGLDQVITLNPTSVTLAGGQRAHATLPSLSLG